ncbi:sigma-70 family RNA polymerase sigma factor [Kamptonema cortianum]|nr:sigma-70 family RNA polymerase sigma factor [Geitlerinema splendidum]MDK3156351.1 sigma-70 family RNA polymerase sigma factor [Kamptonema cortianum]
MQTQVYLDRQEAIYDELSLVARCRYRDEVAMDALVSRHRMRLIRVAANVLRDQHEAEDVAQEAFLKAFREIGKLRDDRAFAGFIYRICVRLCMDRLRSRKTSSEIVELGDGTTGSRIETKILVERLLGKLSPELRMTLVLREMEQLSYDEVADVMKVPVGTVRSRLHAAREKFRGYWIDATKEAR